ncbi:MAG: DUF4258 domain-containing protein [Actinobacteria bacterium]|nr:DUF4258 domain-containing protein [Actinomycetota bacterium]
MPIVFSTHSKNQLKRRKISQKTALDAIRNPDEIVSSFKDRKLRQKQIGGKLLEIVTKTEGSKITIITGYFVKK